MHCRTEVCSFSEFRIYPGHGVKFVRRDGQSVLLSSHKCVRMVQQQKKPGKLHWTQSWRKLNKKGKAEGVARKKIRKVARVVRAIVGMSMDDLKNKRKATVPKAKNVATEAALKEVKDRKKSKAGNANVAPRGGASVPKMQVKHNQK